jgi:hypothetical protein
MNRLMVLFLCLSAFSTATADGGELGTGVNESVPGMEEAGRLVIAPGATADERAANAHDQRVDDQVNRAMNQSDGAGLREQQIIRRQQSGNQ